MSDGRRLPIVTPGVRLDESPEAILERLAEGDSATVIETLKAQVQADPDDGRAWLQLGITYMSIEHWGLAMSALEQAVAIDGDDVDRRLVYARVLLRLRRPDRAAYQLVQAKRLAPDDARVARALGSAFFDKKLYDKAMRELLRARDLAPDDARTHYALGLCHEAKGDVAAAIASVRKAITLDGTIVEAHQTLADLLASMGEHRQAVDALVVAQSLHRTSVQIAQNLEVLRRALQQLEAQRLLGKSPEVIADAAIVTEGGLQQDDLTWRSDALVLAATLDDAGHVRRLALALVDPAAAAKAPSGGFAVTVVDESGGRRDVDLATAATLTFLREALGCNMTAASRTYKQLVETRQPVSWGDARVAFDQLQDGDAPRHAVVAEIP